MQKIINITDFYTRNKEEQGSWMDLISNGVPSGIQVKVIGIHSSTGEKAGMKFQNERLIFDKTEFETEEKRILKMKEMILQFAKELIIDFRSSDGELITMDGDTPATLDDIKNFLLPNCEDFTTQIINFSSIASNYN